MNKVYLIILDGFGLGKGDPGDAIAQAKAPFLKKLMQEHSLAKLKTDGESVGLPSFQTGGSEVGHITIGSGRVVKQMLTKINDQIESGEFFENKILKNLFEKAKKNNRIHLMGLCSDGGIHSFLPHIFGLQKMAQKHEIKEVYIHAFLDGRDVGERTAKTYLQQIEHQSIGEIASIGGRFFGMDRDENWERVGAHYQTLCNPLAKKTKKSWQEVIDNFYTSSTESDYYLPPTLLNKKGQIHSDDVVIFFNYRTDRARQISAALVDENFDHFERNISISPENYGIFGPYYDGALRPFAFGKENIDNTLGEVVSKMGKTQLRISETEKFNHVTFFFSGENKDPFPGENRILIPSPKCASYAEKPEMSAREQTDAALTEIGKNEYNLVVQNFANSDLVGHSADLKAAISAIEVLDECLSKLIPEIQKKGYEIIITADHGNADEMILDGEPSAAHSKNLVPCIVLSQDHPDLKLKTTGTLADIAPTICQLMEIEKPKEMTGTSLITM